MFEMYLGLAAGRPTPHSLRFVACATTSVSVCKMCSFRVLLSSCCCVTLLASTAAVYLDRRLITSATLAFPRYGGTRQGVAGCPVRRVLHPDTGELHCPLSTTACRGERAEWIVQTRGKDGGHQAECQPAPCAHNNTVFWTDGACHEPEAQGLCGNGMRLYVDRYGAPYCDCKPNHYIWPAHGVCYAAYSQGPCEAGAHLRLLGSGRGVPVCQQNPCIWDHLVQGGDGKCHELGNPALCPAGRVFVASPETGLPECVSSQFLAELSRDLLGCLAGSRLSLLHACQN